MKIVDTLLAGIGALVIALVVTAVVAGQFDLSKVEDVQQLIGGAAVGVLWIAVGVSFSKPKKPKGTRGRGDSSPPA
jgi:hypothetical protein